MTDFLLELRCEEIPARMQAGARAELERLLRREIEAAGVSATDITVWSTPRRLALIARGLPDATQPVCDEAKGPPEGAPDAAIEGFCRKNGVTKDQLELRDVKGRGTWFAVIEKPGMAMCDVLADAIPTVIRDFSWPKSMRWGAASLGTESLRWVRPLSGIVAILGEELVDCAIDGIASSYATHGHRFHCPGEITIGSAADYQEKLRACHVIVDHEERAALIREGARKAAADAGLTLVEDEGLVVENAGLTEWPVPLLGRFDEAFLDVPPEVIQLTARVNQKYFVCENAGGDLANAFVCTANITPADPAVVIDGNRKVLAARLSDARFFWEQDRKTPLAEHAKKLERITFHEKLGTVADKVDRVAKLARWLCEEGIVKSSPLPDGEGPGVGVHTSQAPDTHPQPLPSSEGALLADQAELAARLCKADLVTEMVGEFPELQGLMGGYYARAEGLPDEVADAIRDHYKPVGQGDEVPTAPVTVAVSLADKLDTLALFFAVGLKPTGSKDPFALRRAALGVIAVILQNNIRIPITDALVAAIVVGRDLPEISWNIGAIGVAKSVSLSPFRLPEPEVITKIGERFLGGDSKLFLADRLKVQQREAGVRHDLIDAVFALGGEDDLVRLLARVKALQSFIGTEDGANLLTGYKRAANILKKEDWHGIEGEISRTGEEDPLAGVDDPELAPVIAAKMAERQASGLSHTREPAEAALIDALDAAEPTAGAAIEAEDFTAAMSALASLRAPIDRFFDEVTVNAPQEDVRASRLDLLARFRAAVHKVADFSRIEG
ncbi:MAG: glycine--tRNA ligase subunit beta [Sphingomonadales bacterium BRH_c42]|nr:MAG: glycine--tRNA ligase subunit beta [Sphingomonadales bacterium BRH_c42]